MDGRSDARTAVLPAWSRIRRRTSAHTQFGYATTMTRKVASSVGAISFASLLVLPSAGAPPADGAAMRVPATFHLQVQAGMFTLDAADAPLDDVVRAIGERAGIQVVIEGVLDAPVARSLVAVPLEAGLRRLLGDLPHVMLFAPSAPGEAQRRLLEVRVYGWPDRHGLPPDPAARGPSAAHLFQGERPQRMEAIRELARAGDPRAVPPLGRVLERDTDPGIRGEAARALGEIGVTAAVPALRGALDDKNQSVRIRAIRALARIDGADATGVLGDVLLDGPERRSRLVAAWALGRQGGPVAEAFLQAALQDPDELIRRGVNHALSEMRDPAHEREFTKPY